eukprot:8575077-Pyramimonas_sp.AAC.2
MAMASSGHSGNRDFAQLLSRGSADLEVARWVLNNFWCDECDAHKRPYARRPAAVPELIVSIMLLALICSGPIARSMLRRIFDRSHMLGHVCRGGWTCGDRDVSRYSAGRQNDHSRCFSFFAAFQPTETKQWSWSFPLSFAPGK